MWRERRKMAGIFRGPEIQIATSSGTLAVTVRPRPNWLMALLIFGAELWLAWVAYKQWPMSPPFLRAIWLWALVSSVPAIVYQFVGEEIIEIDAQKLTIRKGIHGWERKREFRIEECRELEWEEGGKGKHLGLQCKVGWRTVKFGDNLSEKDAIEIMTALQQTLPDVAQKICAYPGEKEHFLTLGLNK
jgi:hypothetical protein